MPLYPASELLTLHPAKTVPPGKPDWANLVARETAAAASDALCGPGLYALFLDGALFYIGLHVGNQAATDCSVMVRWHKHVVGHTLRSSHTSFSGRGLRETFDHLPDDPIAEALAACLPEGRAQDLSPPFRHPLVDGSHCTPQKAVFAARHWDVFGPGNEQAMLDRIQCLFVAVPAGWNDRLDGAVGKERGRWARSRWLRPVERDLIETFAPPCNSEIDPGTAPARVTPAEVEAAMIAGLTRNAQSFDRRIFDDEILNPRLASRKRLEAHGIEPGAPPLDAELIEEAIEDGISEEELTLRNRWTPDQARYADALRDMLSPAFELYATGIPDLRVTRAGERRPLLLLATAHKQFRCSTRLDADTCRMLGFADAKPVLNNTMGATFLLDPAVEQAGDLLPLIGAALVRRLGGRPSGA